MQINIPETALWKVSGLSVTLPLTMFMEMHSSMFTISIEHFHVLMVVEKMTAFKTTNIGDYPLIKILSKNHLFCRDSQNRKLKVLKAMSISASCCTARCVFTAFLIFGKKRFSALSKAGGYNLQIISSSGPSSRDYAAQNFLSH